MRRSTSSKSRSRRCPAPGEGARRRGWSTGCSAICWSMSPATRTAPRSASTSCSRRTAPTGRLGLVEFRAFEMPPDARMSLAQQLLVRALIAWFWREPQEGALVRWGTALHDRFMLPHFVWEDFLGVLADLERRRLPLRSRWFEAQREFRFPVPRRGRARRRAAGAAPRAGALARARRGDVRAAAPSRPSTPRSSGCRSRPRVSTRRATSSPATAAACRSPRPASGEYVAGVRFKAWQLAASLHPTMPVHAPLTFDIIDTWSNARSAAASIMSRIRAARTTTPIR